MNILSKRVMLGKYSHQYSRYFMHLMFGGSNYQFYSLPHEKEGLVRFSKLRYSTTNEINKHSCYFWEEEHEEKADPQISLFTHKSNAQELIEQIPVIEVDGDVAR